MIETVGERTWPPSHGQRTEGKKRFVVWCGVVAGVGGGSGGPYGRGANGRPVVGGGVAVWFFPPAAERIVGVGRGPATCCARPQDGPFRAPFHCHSHSANGPSKEAEKRRQEEVEVEKEETHAAMSLRVSRRLYKRAHGEQKKSQAKSKRESEYSPAHACALALCLSAERKSRP